MFWFALSIWCFKTNNLVEYPSHKILTYPSKRCNLRLRPGSILCLLSTLLLSPHAQQHQTSPVTRYISEISCEDITELYSFARRALPLSCSAADAAAPSLIALSVWPFPNGSAHLTLPWEVEKVENPSLIPHCALRDGAQWVSAMAGSDFKWYAGKIFCHINQSGKEAETFPEVGNILKC